MSTKNSSATSIVFLPFDLNVSFPNKTNPYIRIQSEFSESKRNDIGHILDDKNEQYQKFKKVLGVKNNSTFKHARSIIDSSKYFDFIVSNFNYDNSNAENTNNNNEKGQTSLKKKRVGFLDWYEKLLPYPVSYRTQEGNEFEIKKFGVVFNDQTRSGSLSIEIDWKGEENKLELLSKTDFLRYHDKDRSRGIIQIEKISFERSNAPQENQFNEFKIKTFPADISKDDKIVLRGEYTNKPTKTKGKIAVNRPDETKNITIGFCYSKDPDPTVSSDSVKCLKAEKLSNGVFNSILDVEDLEPGETYYFRYYVVDENKEYSYGTTMTFIASKYYKEAPISISSIVKENFGEIYELIFFNHAKPILLHLIKDDNLLEQEQKELSKLIYKTLRIPARFNNEKSFPINYDEIVNLKIPDARIIFGTMNEGVVIVDNRIGNLNEINKYLPAFVLALNQREFLLKVIRLVPYVNVNNQSELKAIKQFITEVYLKQLSFSVSIYNEIDLLFKELQMKFQIELLMNDNKESINEIHQLIENFVTDEKNAEDQRKEKYLNSIILGLTIIQVVSIFYTLFNDYLGKSKNLIEIFLSINSAIIICLFYIFIRQKTRN